jgi:hypothetical protein
MGGVRFQDADAAILYCIPERGCDLNFLVRRYTCFERTAVPSYETVAGCLGRAVRAGAMPVPAGGHYRLTTEWYSHVHRRDEEFYASEYAMVAFMEELEAQEWPPVGAEFVLPEAEFQQAADHTRQHLDTLFAPYRSRSETDAAGDGRA